MKIEKLCEANVHQYMKYLKNSLIDEPNMMCIDEINEEEIITRVKNSDGFQSFSLLAIEDEEVIGRIEYHFYSCMQDGYRMGYVNWIYVARKHRHMGIAQALFKTFEEECTKHDIDEYFLIQAKNEGANQFYQAFENAKNYEERILRRTLK